MKIAIYNKSWIDHKPNKSQFIAAATARDLASRGHDIHVFTTSRHGYASTAGYHNSIIHHVESIPGIYSDRYFTNAYEVFKSVGNFDIVYSHDVSGHRHLTENIPVVSHWHNISSKQDYNNLKQLTQPTQLTQSTFNVEDVEGYTSHIVSTQHDLQTLVELGIPDNDIKVINYGVADFFKNPKNNLRTHLKIPPGKFVIGLVSDLTFESGITQLLEIIHTLPKNITVVVVGFGPYQEYLKDLEQVIHLQYVNQRDMRLVYNTFDLFINLTTRHSGTNLAVIEAALCGVPLLLSNVGSFAIDFPEATFFNPGDKDELIQQIDSCMNNITIDSVFNLDRFEVSNMTRSIEKVLLAAI